jgi:hypothetical protein
MDEAYTQQLEKRNAELVDQLEKVGALLNSYQKMVKFEIHSMEKLRADAFDPVEIISLTVNNGATNRVFATIEPSFGFGRSWTIEYGNPFENEFAQEKQKKVVVKESDVLQVHKTWCTKSNTEFKPMDINNDNVLVPILVNIAMGLTGTSHIEFQIAPKFG